MCLTNVDPKPTRKYGIGYKSVRKRNDGQYECYDHCTYAGTVQYPLNKWLTDPNDGQATDHFKGAGYRTGFHILLDKGTMLGFSNYDIVTIKVRFKKVTATGNDSCYGNQVVAREIMNLGEV